MADVQRHPKAETPEGPSVGDVTPTYEKHLS